MRTTRRGARAHVSANILHQGTRVHGDFVIDSGATSSFAPLSWAGTFLGRELADLDPFLEELSFRGAQGNNPKGLQLKIELELRLDAEKYQKAGWNQRPRIQETLYFCQNFQHGLLGQSAVFEHFGVVFLNFPTAPEGRRFGLFAPPLTPPR